MLFLPATPDVIAGFIAAAEAAPEELSTIVNVMPAPPLPFLPAELPRPARGDGADGLRGRRSRTAERAIAPFRALADADRRHGPADALSRSSIPRRTRATTRSPRSRTMFAGRRRSASAAETILEGLQALDRADGGRAARVLGGAMARVPARRHGVRAPRAAAIMVNVVAIYERPEERSVHEAWVAGLAAELRQDDAGAYVGFLGDEGEERVRAAYPGDLGPAGGDQGAATTRTTSSGSTRTSRRRLRRRPASLTPSRRASPSPPQRITTSWLYSNTGRAIGDEQVHPALRGGHLPVVDHRRHAEPPRTGARRPAPRARPPRCPPCSTAGPPVSTVNSNPSG